MRPPVQSPKHETPVATNHALHQSFVAEVVRTLVSTIPLTSCVHQGEIAWLQLLEFGNVPSFFANNAVSSGIPLKHLGPFDGTQPLLFCAEIILPMSKPRHLRQSFSPSIGSWQWNIQIKYTYCIYLLCSQKLSTHVLFSLTMDEKYENSNHLKCCSKLQNYF